MIGEDARAADEEAGGADQIRRMDAALGHLVVDHADQERGQPHEAGERGRSDERHAADGREQQGDRCRDHQALVDLGAVAIRHRGREAGPEQHHVAERNQQESRAAIARPLPCLHVDHRRGRTHDQTHREHEPAIRHAITPDLPVQLHLAARRDEDLRQQERHPTDKDETVDLDDGRSLDVAAQHPAEIRRPEADDDDGNHERAEPGVETRTGATPNGHVGRAQATVGGNGHTPAIIGLS
ncbi:MAG TPA: hypothetical protein VFO31_25455 [Vicinamibacterales bacterium]|nr:hypothetical protein [Vicinamibacterales bacterium]